MDNNLDPAAHKQPSRRVAVIVATHQNCYPLDRCLEHHSKVLESPSDVVFVDNGSGGGMTDWVRERFPDVTVVEREKNGFFCGGYNSGLQYAIDHDYEFALIVNADTDIENSDYVKELVAAAGRHPRAAFLGPRVALRESSNIQNTVLRFPWFLPYLGSWLLDSFRTRPNRSMETKIDTRVDFLNGVCVLCRVSALREIGLMDEVMGGYVEDTDWSWRARKMGWNSVFVPVASIVHHQPTEDYQHHSMKSFMLRRNHIYWHRKEGHLLQASLFSAFSIVLATLRCLRAMLTQDCAEGNRQYLSRFRKVVAGLMSQRPVGEWFGPPIGKW